MRQSLEEFVLPRSLYAAIGSALEPCLRSARGRHWMRRQASDAPSVADLPHLAAPKVSMHEEPTLIVAMKRGALTDRSDSIL